MKPHLARNRVPIAGMILLAGGSTILGLAIGVLAYLISTLIYFVVIFSLIMGGATMLAYFKLLQFTKVRHSMIAASVGLITGILVALAYYGTPYLVLRHDFIDAAQNAYQVSADDASDAFDGILEQETGSTGLVGYLKLRAREVDEYTNYLVEAGMPVHEFSFTLKSTWAWLYWLLETLFFSVPTAWIGYDVGKRLFSESAHDWYENLPHQLCAVPLENRERVLTLLRGNRLHEIAELGCSEDEIAHPRIEIYEQHSQNRKGDILISVRQTSLDMDGKIRRTIVGQWEVPEWEFAPFADAMTHTVEAG